MPKVTFKNQTIDTAPGKPLKEFSSDNSLPIAYGCEEGVCGTCLLKVVAGAQGLSPMEDKEKQTLEAMGMNDGTHRLACQCKITGDTTIEI